MILSTWLDPLYYINRKKKDFFQLFNVLMKIHPCIVDLIGSVHQGPNKAEQELIAPGLLGRVYIIRG